MALPVSPNEKKNCCQQMKKEKTYISRSVRKMLGKEGKTAEHKIKPPPPKKKRSPCNPKNNGKAQREASQRGRS